MENTVNIFDLVVQELNRTESLKSSIEAKAIGFMTPVTLILGILVTFLAEVYKRKDVCQMAWNMLFLVSAILFVLCVVLLVLFAKVLMPSEMNYFNAEGLIRLHSKDISEADKMAQILKDVTTAVEENKKKIRKLNRHNHIISCGVFILIFGFVIANALFFLCL